MKRPALLLLVIFYGCPGADVMNPDATVTPQADATTFPDAADAAADAGVNADATADDAAPDMDAAAQDALPNDADPQCNAVARIDGIFFGRFGAPWTFDPTAANPLIITPRPEQGEWTAWAVGKVRAASGYDWHAQISHFTMFDSHRAEAAVEDPLDGSIYVAVELQASTSTRTVFYNADGTIGREVVPVGRSRQSNLFVVKYSATGQVLWLTRFGPNGPGGDRAGHISGIGLVQNNVRVSASIEGSSPIIFAAGEPSSFEYAAGDGTAFWADFSRADGSYQAGSARFIEGADPTSESELTPHGTDSINAAGETAIGGNLVRDRGAAALFTIGVNGPSPVTVTTTQSVAFVAKLGVNGAPIFAGTIDGGRGRTEIRGVAMSDGGEVIAGGQFGILAARGRFQGATTTLTLDFDAQESFLVAYGTNGEPRWAKLITGTARNAVSELNVFGDGIYLMGVGSPAETVFGSGEPNETRMPGSGGYFLAKFSLANGDFQWVRAFAPTTAGVDFADAYIALEDNGEVVVPSFYSGLTISGGASETMLAGERGLRLLRFSNSGDYLGCSAFGLGMGAYSLREP